MQLRGISLTTIPGHGTCFGQRSFLGASPGPLHRRSPCQKTVLCVVQKKNKAPPLQQKILSGFLNLSSLPYSSYVPKPSTFMHNVDPRIKQGGTVMLLLLLTKSGAPGQALIAGWLLAITLLNTPWRIARPTLLPLLAMSVLYFLLTAAFADGTPPNLQSHVPADSLDNLPSLADSNTYSYVLFKFFIVNVTRKSLRLAVSASCLVVVAIQSASLCLITTSPEQLANSLMQLIAPLRFLGVQVKEIGFSLLLSLRFLTTVFDEIRNLALGVAVRGIDWRSLKAMGSLHLLATTVTQLFRKLFQTSDNVAQAMVIRGFRGPQKHHLYLTKPQTSHPLANIFAVLMLVGVAALVILTEA